jgi:pyrroline-5-carboxylate reductase
MKILFMGYGHMGSALGEAWLQSGLVRQVLCVDPAAAGGLRADPYGSIDELYRAGANAGIELIVLALKPALIPAVLRSLPPVLAGSAPVISIAAGVTVAALSAALPAGSTVIRAMPNTPVLRRAGCTGLYSDPSLNPALRVRIGELFAAVGSAHWVGEEAHLDAVTALSGSGPAYYHLFSEALADAGVALGLDAKLARQLAADTAWGAATLQHQPAPEFATLRQAVTSPNGTTAAAIEVFERDRGLRRLVADATLAAWKRSVELSRC